MNQSCRGERGKSDREGTTKRHRLEENLVSVEVTLSPDAFARINRALDSMDIVGEHYPKYLLSRVGK
ncbi:hypothetical protein [Lelliottia sp. WAP21]|uniref:hypothetical protein n=1 Tax=Lelliottia sp. WAP21 TaxID=2877426 RepID=UPI001E572CC1|nr:hypothetical protein [Lelliottia sp. WAP21]